MKKHVFCKFVLSILYVSYGRELFEGRTVNSYVKISSQAESVFFFSVQGVPESSCGGSYIRFYNTDTSIDDEFVLRLNNLVVQGHILTVDSCRNENRVEIRYDNPKFDLMDLSCDHPKHFWVYQHSKNLYFGSGVDVSSEPIWQTRYCGTINRITFSQYSTSGGPLYDSVPPFALPQIREINLSRVWTNSELFRLFDFDLDGLSCIDVDPIQSRIWTLTLRIPMLTGHFSELVTVTVTGNMTCTDTASMYVSVGSNSHQTTGKAFIVIKPLSDSYCEVSVVRLSPSYIPYLNHLRDKKNDIYLILLWKHSQ